MSAAIAGCTSPTTAARVLASTRVASTSSGSSPALKRTTATGTGPSASRSAADPGSSNVDRCPGVLAARMAAPEAAACEQRLNRFVEQAQVVEAVEDRIAPADQPRAAVVGGQLDQRGVKVGR